MSGARRRISAAGRSGFLAVIVVAFLGLAGPAAAQAIPALADLPPSVAADHPDLSGRRAALVAERETLHGQINALNAECASVEVGSDAERSCDSDRAKLVSALASHIAQSNAFNADLAAAATTAGPRPEPPVAKVFASGEFYFVTKDGHRLTGADAAKLPLDAAPEP